eukprot:scaffold17414_cov53-Phaeocystis_antarctica.AAC.7
MVRVKVRVRSNRATATAWSGSRLPCPMRCAMLPEWCCVSRATARCPPLSSSKASSSSCCIPSIAIESAYCSARPRCSASSSACAMRSGFHS